MEMIRKQWAMVLLIVTNFVLLIMYGGKALTNQNTMISYGLFGVITIFFVGLFIYNIKKLKMKEQQHIRTTWDDAWKKLKRNKTAIFGMIVVIIFIYMSILAPFLATSDPLQMDWGGLTQLPSPEHILGTDEFGRDIFSRALYGSRVAIGIGLLAVVLNSLIGTVLGVIAGYFGGKVDSIIMRAIEVWNSIPFILMAIALMAALGSGIGNLILVVSITGIMEFARLIRGSVLQLKQADYISAAKVMALPHRKIILQHILPNCIAPIIVLGTLRIGETILTIAGLSFLGLGVQDPTPSWGSMLSSGQQYLTVNPFMSIVPGTLILLTVFAFNLFGDGLRDALDPKLRD